MQENSKTEEANNIKEGQKESNTEALNQNLDNHKTEILQKSELLTKPPELIDFDAMDHFKENISFPDKNDLGPISPNSYYCINCKHSECGFYDKNKHIFINRLKIAKYDPHFFDEMDKNIHDALDFNRYIEGMKNNINEYVDKMKEELDKLRDKKFNEIDIFFKENEKNFIKIQKEYLNVRKNVEEYYEINKKFFHIEVTENNNNNEEDKSINEDKEDNNINSIYIEDIDVGSPNRDIENAVFLLNFEMMNLCETKNFENINYIKNIQKRIDAFNEQIHNDLNKDLNTISQLLIWDTKINNYIDNYWDINIRTKKYTEMIQQFKETICDIYHRMGSLDKIKDLIDIFDSKLRKNKNIIFGQEYFNQNNNTNNNKENINNNEPRTTKNSNIDNKNQRKRNNSSLRRTASSKGKSLSKYKNTRGKSSAGIKRHNLQNIKNNTPSLTLSNDIGLRNLIKNKNEKYNKTETHVSINNNLNNVNLNNLEKKKSYQKLISFQNCIPDDIILDKRVIQRFFAYSISELYKKNFGKIDLNNNDLYYNIINKDNIYLNKNKINDKNNDTKNKSKRGKSSKKNKINNIKSVSNHNLMNYKNNNNEVKVQPLMNDQNKIKEKLELEYYDPNQYNIKSVSYLSNYTNRYNSLKEIAKPIIGTTQIQLFFQKYNKIIRKNIPLNKEEHGYSLFPEGCRHILIENNLYIIGGTNHIRQPINIVLEYNILFGTLKRLPDLAAPHSYHTVEYLENFDCIICIGGENSNICEIMNLEDKKWLKLPNLNYQRANANIYYNSLTSELFVLFGICGIMSDRLNYSDSIEVLEINDIKKGWIIVDYYKTPGLNLKVNYCMTMPFTKEQLLIYGGSNMRTFTKNIFALFHMSKNECNKVDTQTMELIKLEEKKSRLVDFVLTKLN